MDIRDGLPPTTDGMVFEYYELDMENAREEKFTKKDLLEILKLMGKIRLGVEPFNQLPDTTKRHFVVYDRYGNSESYAVAMRKLHQRQRKEKQK